MLKRLVAPLGIMLVFLGLLMSIGTAYANNDTPRPTPGPFIADPMWPVTSTTTAGLSSTLGPRQKASESYRYDWHRGIDIPAPCGTPVYAISDGVVNKAGSVNTGYSDRMLQIKHRKPGISPAQYYYSNYLHLNSVSTNPATQQLWKVGDVITKGLQLGTTGDSEIGLNGICQPGDAGGFDHLHFEIRDGGNLSLHAVHPLLVFPVNATTPQIEIKHVTVTNPVSPVVHVRVTTPDIEPDFDRVELVLSDISTVNPVEIDRFVFDIQDWSYNYTPYSGTSNIALLDTAPAYDGVYDGDYGNGQVSGAPLGVTVMPAQFNVASTHYVIDVIFTDLVGLADPSDLRVEAIVTDIYGNSSSAIDPKNNAPLLTVGADVTVDKLIPVTIAATFTDPNLADLHTATVDWNDGSQPEAAAVTQSAGAGSISASHVYQTPGDYTVTLSVDDGQGGTDSAQLVVTVKETLDLVFVLDLTGSMHDDIAEVKAKAGEIVDETAASGASYRIAVVGFRDHPVFPYGSPNDFLHQDVLAFSSDKNTITGAIQTLTVGGGGDWPEAVYSALMHAIDGTSLGGWRPGSVKSIILMGDAPAHDPEPITNLAEQDVLTAAANIDIQDGNALARAAATTGLTIQSVVISDGPQALDTYTRLAAQTGGSTEHAATAAQVVTAIRTSIQKLMAKTPQANPGGPYTGEEGAPIRFEGSASAVAEDGSTTFHWTFGDATGATGAKIDHVYADDGDYIACLTVSNGLRWSDTRCTTVTVANRVPSIQLNESYRTTTGERLRFSRIPFADHGFDNEARFANPEIVSPTAPSVETFKATVDWGTGKGETGEGIRLTKVNGSAETPTTGTVEAETVYAEKGVYAVTVCVIDDDGDAGCAKTQVTVEEVSFGGGGSFLYLPVVTR